jgi:hypothetical protein
MVICLSSFQHLVFLDSDNVAMLDPELLFSEPEYQRTGTLFWKDFWDPDWAPDAPLVLGVNATIMPSHTVESGQMLLDKRRCDPWLRSRLGRTFN